MDLHLNDKVVLITGGARGIGAAIVRTALAEGARVVVADRYAVIEPVAHSIEIDLIPAENCKRVIDETLEKFGAIDALINNAGVNDRIGLERGNPKDFIASLERNLIHVYNLTYYALPALKKSQGSIVNISSKTAVTGQGETSGYVAAKAGILGLTREWAVELIPYGIRVNAILPAEVMTPLYRQWLQAFPDPEKKLAEIITKIPLGKRMTTAEEIASMAVFLISPTAAGHITGQYLYVDGGYVHLDRALT